MGTAIPLSLPLLHCEACMHVSVLVQFHAFHQSIPFLSAFSAIAVKAVTSTNAHKVLDSFFLLVLEENQPGCAVWWKVAWAGDLHVHLRFRRQSSSPSCVSCCCVPLGKSLLPWSSVPRPVKLAPTSEAVCAVGVDSYREEFNINNVVKKSLKNGLCHNYKTLLSGCRLTTGNQQRREESARFMLGIITGIFLLEVLFHFFIEALPAEIIRKVGIGDPTDSVWPLLATVLP